MKRGPVGTLYVQNNVDHTAGGPNFSTSACGGCGALLPFSAYPDRYKVCWCPNCGRRLLRAAKPLLSKAQIVASVNRRIARYEQDQKRPCRTKGCQLTRGDTHGHMSFKIRLMPRGIRCAICRKPFKRKEKRVIEYTERQGQYELKDGAELARVANYHVTCGPARVADVI